MRKLVRALQTLFSRKRLTGERIFLRPPKRRDSKKWQHLRSISKEFLIPWEPSWDKYSCSRKTFFRQLKNSSISANLDQAYSFYIFKNSDNTLIGGVNVGNVRRGASQCAALGYWIGKPYAEKGYMMEALNILIPSLFVDLRFNRIEAATLPENIPSRKLLEKVGFTEEGLLREYLNINGKWRDHIIYGLLSSDIRKKNT